MPQVSFRPLTSADLDAVVDLTVRCDALVAQWAPRGWQLPPEWASAERQTWEHDLGDDAVWSEVACGAGGDVIGVIAALSGDQTTFERGGGHLMSLFVEPTLHGRGIGGRLLARSDEWMRSQGWREATVNVLEGAPAVGFYLAHGWSPDGRRGRYAPFDLPTIGLGKAL